ncbi:MAG: PilT/PilU family type 4a pilus ATPase [Phycisphaerae bacterium]
MSGTIHPEIERLLAAMTQREASDLHLVAGYPAMLRVHGELHSVDGAGLPGEQVLELMRSIAPAGARERIGRATDVDFAAGVVLGGTSHRFRVNVFQSRGQAGACLRLIPSEIPPLASLGFPAETADRILALNAGLVLLCGVTGSGKTTSLAALIQRINSAGGQRVITIEEPIEYVYPRCERSVVTQREVGTDVASFAEGLRSGLRQDPDVLLVGEIRDRETAQLALSAAETGHVILSTLHTADAKGAITRLIDLFPPELHNDARTQLSLSLRYVVSQHLLPPPQKGARRVLAVEVLAANFAVRACIRSGKIEGLDSAIQSGKKDGMVSLDAQLRELVQRGQIDLATARQFAKDPAELGG